MNITCSAPGIDHVHWTARPADRFTLESALVSARVGHARSTRDGGSVLARLDDLVLCRPQAGGPCDELDVLTEQEALQEQLADLEEGCDPDTVPLREEIASRLNLLAATAA